MVGQELITQLVDRVDLDDRFAADLESDPLHTLRDAGFAGSSG